MEKGPELRRATYSGGITSVSTPGGTMANQTADPQTSAPGVLSLRFSVAIDPATYGQIVVERVLPDGSWGALQAAEMALGKASGSGEDEVVILPLQGFTLGTPWRVRLGSLRDAFGRPAEPQPDVVVPFPPAPAAGQVGTFSFSFDQPFAVAYDSATAAGETLGTATSPLFPGGQPMLFHGAWVDPVSGLSYLRARWYDPEISAWLSKDPEGSGESASLYAFVGGQPHELIDPLGTEGLSLLDIMGIAADTADGIFNPMNTWKNLQRAAGGAVGVGQLAGKTVKELGSTAIDFVAMTVNEEAAGRMVERAEGIANSFLHPIDTFVDAEGHSSVFDQILDAEGKGDYFGSGRAAGEKGAEDALKVIGAAEGLASVGKFAKSGASRMRAASGSTSITPRGGWKFEPRKVQPVKCPSCFAAGTLVFTPDGYVPIDSLNVGDRVLTPETIENLDQSTEVDGSWQLVTMEIVSDQMPATVYEVKSLLPAKEIDEAGIESGSTLAYNFTEIGTSKAKVISIDAPPAISKRPGRVVLSTFRHVRNQTFLIHLGRSNASRETRAKPARGSHEEAHSDDEEGDATPEPLRVSADHPFWVEGEDWLHASGLRPGMCVRGANGRYFTVSRIEELSQALGLVNLEVENEHAFFVGGAAALLVHNSNCPKVNLLTEEQSFVDRARDAGVRRAMAAERRLVESGHPGTVRGGWTWAERKLIAETGEFPGGIRWHHLNDVKRHPSLAADPRNVIPARGGNAGHVKMYHPHGTRRGSKGTLLDREGLIRRQMGMNE